MRRWLADVFSGKWHLRWLVFRFLQDFSGCGKSLNICLFTRTAEEFKKHRGATGKPHTLEHPYICYLV